MSLYEGVVGAEGGACTKRAHSYRAVLKSSERVSELRHLSADHCGVCSVLPFCPFSVRIRTVGLGPAIHPLPPPTSQTFCPLALRGLSNVPAEHSYVHKHMSGLELLPSTIRPGG